MIKPEGDAVELTRAVELRGMVLHLLADENGEQQLIEVHRQISENSSLEVFSCRTVGHLVAFLSGWDACLEHYAQDDLEVE